MYVPLPNRKKLDVKAERGTSVGISEGSLCYQVNYHVTKTLYKPYIYVTFLEDDGDQLKIKDENSITLDVSLNKNVMKPTDTKFLAGIVRAKKQKVVKLLSKEYSSDDSSSVSKPAICVEVSETINKQIGLGEKKYFDQSLDSMK